METAFLLLSVLVSLSFQGNEKNALKAASKQVPTQTITLEEAPRALHELTQSDSFLANAPYMEPLAKQIKSENAKISLLKASLCWSSYGHFVGSWSCDTKTNEFSYLAKSLKRDELYVIRGNFFLDEKRNWIAKVSAASVTKLSNFFGKKECDKIKKGMTLQEVSKVLGIPPGVYFAEEASFMFPGGRRFSPFWGTAKEFQASYPSFFESTKGKVKKDEWIQRAWISNDLAIWITFDENRRTKGHDITDVMCPRESLAEFEKNIPALDKPALK